MKKLTSTVRKSHPLYQRNRSLMSFEDASKELGRHESTIRKYVKKGLINKTNKGLHIDDYVRLHAGHIFPKKMSEDDIGWLNISQSV